MDTADGSIPAWLVRLTDRHPRFDSLLVPAYVDRERSGNVVLFPRVIFVGTAGGYITFGIDEVTGQLHLGESTKPFLPVELTKEPSVQPVLVDLTANFIGDGPPVSCSSLAFYLNEDSSSEKGIFRAVVIEFEAEGILFDTFSFSGIRISVVPTIGSVLHDQPNIKALRIRPAVRPA